MELEIKLNGKTFIYHIPKSCDVNFVIRDGKVKDVIEKKRLTGSIVECKRL